MTFFLTRVLVQITPNTLTNIYVILNGQFKHILKAFLPYLKIFKCFTRSVTTNMTFFTLFSFSYAQNIIFLSIVINSTNLHHKRVPVVLLVDYCLLLTEENSALHSYFYLLRMAGLHRNAPILIPNRTFLVRFGGISGEFGRAMVRILVRRSRAKIPMVRPNELDTLPKRTKKGAIRYLPYPNSS